MLALWLLNKIIREDTKSTSSSRDTVPYTCEDCENSIEYYFNEDYANLICQYCGLETFVIHPIKHKDFIDELINLSSIVRGNRLITDLTIYFCIMNCLAVTKADGVITVEEGKQIVKNLKKSLGEGYNNEYVKLVYNTAIKHYAKFSKNKHLIMTMIFISINIFATLNNSKELVSNVKDELIDFLIESLFITAYADGVFDKNELYVLKKYTEYFGYSQEEFNDLLEMVTFDSSSRRSYQGKSDKAKTQPLEVFENLYELFGIDRNSSKNEIRKGYLNLVKQYHPDQYNNLPKDMQKFAEERFKEIQNQYEILLDKALN